MPFSQIIPPLPSPTEPKRLFYTSVSLLLSPTQGYRYHLSKFHIYSFSSVQFRSVAHLCPTLCNLMDCSSPGPPVPGILQSRKLEWVAISFSNA